MVNGAPVVRPLKTPVSRCGVSLSLRGVVPRLAAFAAAEVFFERGLVEFESRGYSVEGHADRFAVRLSEYGNSE